MSNNVFPEQTKRFIKAFQKLRSPIKLKVIERTELFLQNQKDQKLNIHELKGILRGTWSFNVTGDYRIWFRKEKNESDEEEITFIHVGTHSQLYS